MAIYVTKLCYNVGCPTKKSTKNLKQNTCT